MLPELVPVPVPMPLPPMPLPPMPPVGWAEFGSAGVPAVPFEPGMVDVPDAV